MGEEPFLEVLKVPLTGKASSQEKTPNMTLKSLKETEERRKWVTLGWKQP